MTNWMLIFSTELCFITNFENRILMTRGESMTNALAPMGTASFFDIAGKMLKRLPHFVRNDKKDIEDSGKQLQKIINTNCSTKSISSK